MVAGEQKLVEKHARLPLALLAEQILHVRRQAANGVQPQIQAIFLHIAVGGHIVKVLGCGNLAGQLAAQLHAVRLDEFDEPVELIGGDKGIHRIAEQEELRLRQRLPQRGKVLFQLPDLLAHMEDRKGMLRVQGGQVQRRVQGGRVGAFRAGVQDENLHRDASKWNAGA